MTHNFVENKTKPKNAPKTERFVRYWYCSGCDSLVEMPGRFDKQEVNKKIAMRPNFPCLPPVLRAN